VASLGHGEVLKVVARSPVAANDELVAGVGEVLDPVDLARHIPEVFTSLERQLAKPELLRLGTVLGVKLARVDEDWAFRRDELLDVV